MIGTVMMCASVALFLLGMVGGIAMGILHDFSLGPAHAHLNLIGGVMLFLFGLFYRVVPAAGATSLARIQGGIHIAGAVLFPLGIALSIAGGPAYMPLPVIGSLVVTAAVALFGIVVVRSIGHDTAPRVAGATGQPASHHQPVRAIVQASDSPAVAHRRNDPTDIRTDFRTHGQGIEG